MGKFKKVITGYPDVKTIKWFLQTMYKWARLTQEDTAGGDIGKIKEQIGEEIPLLQWVNPMFKCVAKPKKSCEYYEEKGNEEFTNDEERDKYLKKPYCKYLCDKKKNCTNHSVIVLFNEMLRVLMFSAARREMIGFLAGTTDGNDPSFGEDIEVSPVEQRTLADHPAVKQMLDREGLEALGKEKAAGDFINRLQRTLQKIDKSEIKWDITQEGVDGYEIKYDKGKDDELLVINDVVVDKEHVSKVLKAIKEAAERWAPEERTEGETDREIEEKFNDSEIMNDPDRGLSMHYTKPTEKLHEWRIDDDGDTGEYEEVNDNVEDDPLSWAKCIRDAIPGIERSYLGSTDSFTIDVVLDILDSTKPFPLSNLITLLAPPTMNLIMQLPEYGRESFLYFCERGACLTHQTENHEEVVGYWELGNRFTIIEIFERISIPTLKRMKRNAGEEALGFFVRKFGRLTLREIAIPHSLQFNNGEVNTALLNATIVFLDNIVNIYNDLKEYYKGTTGRKAFPSELSDEERREIVAMIKEVEEAGGIIVERTIDLTGGDEDYDKGEEKDVFPINKRGANA